MQSKSNYYDIIVIGLGAMGSATLYQLTEKFQIGQKRPKLLALEQYKTPHEYGSSHGQSRLSRLSSGEHEDYRFTASRSNELWSMIEAKTQGKFGQLHQITGGLIIGPLSVENSFLQKTLIFSKKYGINHHLLSAQELMQDFPQIKNVSSDFIAYYEKDMGLLVPENCIRAQLELAIHNGAEIHTEEKLISFERTDQGMVTVRTDKGEYYTDKLVLTVGSWITELLEPQYAQLFKISRQVVYWFAVEKTASSQFEVGRFLPTIWFSRDQNMFYGFPSVDGLVKLSHEAAFGWSTNNANEALSKKTNSFVDNIRQVVREVSPKERHFFYKNYVVPNLKGVSDKCLYAKTCLYTCTPDLRFIIDFLPGYNEQVILASPCSGRGFKHSAAIGEALAERIIGIESAIDVMQLFGYWGQNRKSVHKPMLSPC